eukprot:1143756-Pelagomonas_calceolata.AAC.1
MSMLAQDCTHCVLLTSDFLPCYSSSTAEHNTECDVAYAHAQQWLDDCNLLCKQSPSSCINDGSDTRGYQ